MASRSRCQSAAGQYLWFMESKDASSISPASRQGQEVLIDSLFYLQMRHIEPVKATFKGSGSGLGPDLSRA